jgi:hypothetical protein
MSASISITELRQRLFQLADKVAETGEPLLIERRGVRLRLVRDDPGQKQGGRLVRLKPRRQSVVVGPALDPHESPAQWSPAWPKVAEPETGYAKRRPRKSRKRS